jgi:hypothetical protein
MPARGLPLAWAVLGCVGPLTAQAPAVPIPTEPFVENRGQWAESVRFAARGPGWRAAVEAHGWRLALPGPEGRACVVRFDLAGVVGDPQDPFDALGPAPAGPRGEFPGGAPSHYFGRERSGVGARSFQRLRWRTRAPGVELVLRCEDQRLEYDLELEPDALPDSLEFEVEGGRLLDVAPDGSLPISTPLGELRQSPPRAFEVGPDGTRHECRARFVRRGETRFGFALEERRGGLPLVIDPALVWSTYIGGNTAQSVRAIADSGGGALIAGSTESADFPITPGVFDPNFNGGTDAFVSALDGQGRLLWSTFLGGAGVDVAHALVRDGLGAVTVAGTTRSGDFPATLGAFDTSLGGVSDGFVARLSANGAQLQWCTYLGGAKHDELLALFVDSLGRATVGGWSTSFDAPVTPGTYGQQLAPGTTADGYLARLSASGAALVFGSYLGGASVDQVRALAPVSADPSAAFLAGGSTSSADFPHTLGGPQGGEDGFVTRLDGGATQLDFSAFLGGSGNDQVFAVAADGNSAALAAGRTESPDMPTTAGVPGPNFGGAADGFLARLGSAGALLESSYLGGAGSDEVLCLAYHKDGALFAAGWTDSSDFPVTAGAFDRLLNIPAQSFGGDAFVVRAAADLSTLDYATYVGAAGDERALALAVVDRDTVLLAGETDSFFFPTTPGAHRTSRGVLATLEGFATRLDLLRHPVAYGVGKLNSAGASPVLRWTGFPSVADQNFVFALDGGIPNQPAVVFMGKSPANQPFLGGTLYVSPPVKRIGAQPLDFVGYAEFPFTLGSAFIGTSIFAQGWFKDPWDPQSCGLSNGLEVTVHP